MTNPICLIKVTQALFMAWLVLGVKLVHGDSNEVRCIEKERQALLQLKAGLIDAHGLLSSWGSEEDKRECCQWKGVGCSDQTGHVLMLDLHGEPQLYSPFQPYMYSRFPLRGEIHKSLAELQHLEYLDLSWNDFDIHFPYFLGSLTNLNYLDLSNCLFDGNIPTQFGNLSQLKYLNLGFNIIEGSIPDQLGNLTKLMYLNLSHSSLEGTIPSQLGNLPRLHYLDLSNNNLGGAIPSQLGNLSKLQHLDLSQNELEGAIPSQLGKLSNLQKLDLGFNFRGSSKLDHRSHSGGEWLSNLTSLTRLDLSVVLNLNNSHNWLQIIGKLPNLRELLLSSCSLSDHFILSVGPSKLNFSTSLAVLQLSGNTFKSSIIFRWVSNVSPNLVELDLSGNNLEGPLPIDFGTAMTSLELLDLSATRLRGGFLTSLMNICTLRSLHLQENNLIQDLPSILRHLSVGCVRYSLQHLFLEKNQITGTLPDLSMFASLKTLELSYNQLNGSIPQGIRLPSQLQSLSMKANSLTGGIPKSFGNTCTFASLDLSNNSFSDELAMIFHHLSGCARYSLQELNLNTNQIKGTLPDLSMFQSLKILDVSKNRLNGKIPESSKLPSQLEYLSMESNLLTGGIPKSFQNACSLRLLHLSDNNLSDELAVIIHHLSGCARHSLLELGLSHNQIKGTLPQLSIFSTLSELYLNENRLHGKIPQDVHFPSQLELLWLDSNYLEGVITDSHFANMSNLKFLDLSNNSLALTFSKHWIPPFQLSRLRLGSCNLGPSFPNWLQTQKILYRLDMHKAGISANVPEWLWALSAKLDRMDISNNNLTGTIPNLPLSLKLYSSIILSANQFEGSIPLFLRSNAVSLDLSKNRFSEFHMFLCANHTIEPILGQLDLSNNKLSGQIPYCWSHFKSLAYLDLSNNYLSGQIPASIGSLLKLQALILRNNSLIGDLPFSLRSSKMLVMLDVGENKLSGPIPSWIGSSIQQLKMLSLRRNLFFGSLPLSLCYLTSIQLLDLSSNNLYGQIPKCIKNFTAMVQENFSAGTFDRLFVVFDQYGRGFQDTYDLNTLLMWKRVEHTINNNKLLLKSIDLSSNQLSGEIPIEMGNLVQLVSMNLSTNNLTGIIPSEIGRLKLLEFLDLSRNHFFGSIPSSLAQIDRLGMLDLSHNNLSGEIPIGTQLQSFNASSYEDNLDLCGRPLEKMCKGSPQEPKVQHHDEDEHWLLNHSFYISMTFGFIIGFWGIFGSILVNRSWRHAYFKFLNNLTDNIYITVAVKVA